MKIYIVVSQLYYGGTDAVEAAFSTHEKAMTYATTILETKCLPSNCEIVQNYEEWGEPMIHVVEMELDEVPKL